MFIPTWGNDPIWLIFFQIGWNHQLVIIIWEKDWIPREDSRTTSVLGQLITTNPRVTWNGTGEIAYGITPKWFVTGSLNRYLIGGMWFVYISGIYCQLGDYMLQILPIFQEPKKLHWQNVLNAKWKALLIAWPVLLPVLPWPSWCLWEVKGRATKARWKGDENWQFQAETCTPQKFNMEPETEVPGKGDSFWKPSFFRFYVKFLGSTLQTTNLFPFQGSWEDGVQSSNFMGGIWDTLELRSYRFVGILAHRNWEWCHGT